MREYHVHFSFYSEEWGNFDDVHYSVIAKDPFEAREKAWVLCDQDSETPLRNNIKQLAVTWTPNMLDAGDYFYSHAADIKQYFGRVLNVSIPNDRIANNERQHQLDIERCSLLSALQTLDDVARDLYSDKGMIPPSIYEELHYADRLYEELGWGEKSDALWGRMEKAKKWDKCAIYTIRDMFKDGYTTLCGETVLFHEHFGRNGIYPIHNQIDERDYSYIRRWRDKRKIDRLRTLSLYKETDVITNSAGHMDYAWQTLLLDDKTIAHGYQTPENQLWRPLNSSDHDEDIQDGMLYVENLITGQRTVFNESDFLGVLRPDIIAMLDFDALKNEYAATCCECAVDDRSADDYDADIEDGELEQ